MCIRDRSWTQRADWHTKISPIDSTNVPGYRCQTGNTIWKAHSSDGGVRWKHLTSPDFWRSISHTTCLSRETWAAIPSVLTGIRDVYKRQALYPVLMSAGDALTSIGLAYIFWSLVLYAISRGGLDGVFYITHNIARTFKRRKDCKMCIRDRLRMSAFTLNLLFWPQIPLLMSRKTSRLWRNKSLVFLCRAS